MKKIIELEPEFLFRNSLRFVNPYYFRFHCYAKKRWIGRTILDIFQSEFHDRPPEYYFHQIRRGRMFVNDVQVGPDHIIKDHDFIESLVHRHEPPVTDYKIQIIHEDEQLLIINKPGSMPVHPAGQYNFNTCLLILYHELGYKNLYIVNRLDRLTSGLILLAKSSKKAAELAVEIRERSVEKTYIARVKGEFPIEAECDVPIMPVYHKVGVNIASPEGKPSFTSFKRISYNGRTSVIECYPRTGRTHQIRVHLQFLGYPIANDPIYCSSAWGPEMAKGGIDLSKVKEIVNKVTGKAFCDDTAINYDIDGCIECELNRKDPNPNSLEIWLHAHRYTGQDWSFQTNFPEWAQDDFDDSFIEDRFWKHGGVWDNEANGAVLANT